LSENPVPSTDSRVTAAELRPGVVVGGLSVSRVSGLRPDRWLKDGFRLAGIAGSPVAAVEVEGFLPQLYPPGTRLIARIGGSTVERLATGPGTFSWTIPVSLRTGMALDLELRADPPYIPAENGSNDRDRLGFVLIGLGVIADHSGTVVPEPQEPARRDKPTMVAPYHLQPVICADPVFIIGSSRSGTSALPLALARHSAFATYQETNLGVGIFGGDALRGLYEGWSMQLQPGVIGNGFEEFSAWVGVGLNAMMTAAVGGRRWVEQSPSNTAVATRLATAFPGALFIHIVRDGRKVVHSMINSGFPQRYAHDFEFACRQWRNNVWGAMHFCEGQPDLCLTVVNEQLARDPAGEFARILAFLGADQESGPADWFGANRVNSSFRNPDDRPADPWSTWDESRREVFRSVCGGMMSLLWERGLLDDDLAGAPWPPRTVSHEGGERWEQER
jgi:hypothetical protein